MNRLKVIFAGTPEFAVPSLSALIAADLDLIAVYTQPDRPAGRGRKLQMSPVKRLALDAGIQVLQPQSLKRDPDAVERLRALGADLMVVVAYGLLLPVEVLEAPRLGCVNVHASLLPRWRGAAPIQRSVLAGDATAGVCIMRMEAGLDTGPVYRRAEIPVAPRETGGSLHDRLAVLGAEALIAALPGIADGSARPEPQDDSAATYAHKLTKEEARIDWTWSAAAIERQVRAFDPWPIAYTLLDGETLRIWDAEAEAETASVAPGTLVDTGKRGIRIATGDGLLRITRLQPSGKKPMSAADYLNARSLDGARFD
ncbi:methionyl-tRNA formyltransferase [Imhoffiella purpurea]|uniref:Methionyl-tRNA formyltransferase n=1 Tax=Imhoffiella purpurea TaxID=1249627 RepID=W9VYE2_9GAMM|nr:methionyl-tRNA formyltransferase [Imhoffiella purpurea]EXJ15400.1 Methionyl-tRNA formyltransferase [Imhoffiella purpurea]